MNQIFKMKKIFIFVLTTLLTNLAFAQRKLPEDVIESIKKRIEYGHTPSIVVRIIDKDGPQYYTFGTNTDFFIKVVNAQIIFSAKDGKVDSLTLYQGGKEMLGKRIK